MKTTMPAYLQIMQNIKRDIVSGVLEPNQKLESIKALSSRYSVNPNTVQRSLAALEKEGLLRSNRTAGKYVTGNQLLIKSIRYKEARRMADEFVASLQNLGIHPEELVGLFVNPELPIAETEVQTTSEKV